ncbi:MAG: hypothetical protein AB1679_02265 [Actinomycetota bacterium]
MTVGLLVSGASWGGKIPTAGAAAPAGQYYAEAEASPFKGDFGNGDLALGDGAAALTVARISDTPDAFGKAFAMYPGFFAYFTLYPGAAGGGGFAGLPPLPGAVEIQRSQSGSERKDATIGNLDQGGLVIKGGAAQSDVDAEVPKATSEASVTRLALPSGVVVGGMHSSSSSGVEGLDLVSRAVAHASEIRIGALSIKSMQLVISVRKAVDGKLTVDSGVNFTGAMVNNIPVQIGPFGVTAGSNGAPGVGDRSEEVEKALRSSGVQYVRGGRLERVERDGNVELRRDGLSFRFNAPSGPWGQEYGGGRIGYTVVRLGGAAMAPSADESGEIGVGTTSAAAGSLAISRPAAMATVNEVRSIPTKPSTAIKSWTAVPVGSRSHNSENTTGSGARIQPVLLAASDPPAADRARATRTVERAYLIGAVLAIALAGSARFALRSRARPL